MGGTAQDGQREVLALDGLRTLLSVGLLCSGGPQTLGFVVPIPQLRVLPRAFIPLWGPRGHGGITSSGVRDEDVPAHGALAVM